MINRFETFMTNMSSIYKSIQKLKMAEMAELGLKANHTMILYYSAHYPEGLTVSELAVLCTEDKAAISRSVTELINFGYIARRSNKDGNKYRAKIMLTEAGTAVSEYINEKVTMIVDKAGGELLEEQRQNFYDCLELINNNLNKLCSGLT